MQNNREAGKKEPWFEGKLRQSGSVEPKLPSYTHALEILVEDIQFIAAESMKTPFNPFSTKSYTNCSTNTKAKLLSTTLAETKSSKTMSTLTRLQPQAACIPQLKDCYKFAKHLGKGGEGEVDEFVNKHTGVLFAIKFRKRKDRGRPLEVEILKQLSGNSWIVGFVECFD